MHAVFTLVEGRFTFVLVTEVTEVSGAFYRNHLSDAG